MSEGGSGARLFLKVRTFLEDLLKHEIWLDGTATVRAELQNTSISHRSGKERPQGCKAKK